MKLTKRDVDDVYRLDFGPGTAPIILSEEEMDELRAHLQAERDEQLGRWRDPESPDYVVYRTPEDDDESGRCILLLDENTGDNHWEWERIATSGPGLRYFAAHADVEPRKPWQAAKVGEIWEIGLLELGPSACLVTEGDFVEISKRFEVAIGSSLIESGRRIWPTDAEGEQR